jgi:hypothetical protein
MICRTLEENVGNPDARSSIATTVRRWCLAGEGYVQGRRARDEPVALQTRAVPTGPAAR